MLQKYGTALKVRTHVISNQQMEEVKKEEEEQPKEEEEKDRDARRLGRRPYVRVGPPYSS